MRTRYWTWLALVPFLMGFDASRAREALDAAFHNLYGPDVLAGVELELTHQSGARESIALAYGRKRKAGETRLLVYSAESDRRAPRMLVFQRPGERDQVYLSQGERGEVQPLAGQRPLSAVFGSDFAFWDLHADDADHYSIEVLGRDAIEDEPCRVLRLRPSAGPYAMLLVWLSETRPVILRTDYFDAAGLWKRYRARPHRVVQQLEWWVPMQDELLDLRTGSRTRRKIHNIVVDAGVPDTMFTLSQLSRGRLPSF